jgi:hypothetical protein
LSVASGGYEKGTMNDAGKFNISFTGPLYNSPVTIGDYNTVVQHNRLSPAEAADLERMFKGLRSAVAAQAPPEQREEALKQTSELEQAVVAEEPDAARVKRVLRWFKQHAPGLAGAIVSVVVHPLVGKIVEGAGEAIAGRFDEAIAEAE